ncbi:Regulatory protein KorA (plasmid) [Variovorax sp. SRS16]|uniref:TrfB-related DNA-binding protein n=1 Tax=Variovorax sp. SRS16 TaxID=282217 RepID=UPI0013179BF6|nr:TrfB-related DNA-binding protein [Variovorax sp. SRS16]VTU46095.1 Regulatory protein KorA [Variovorax sp. SRS16]
MKKRLTESQFEAALGRLKLKDGHTRQIARNVLVAGMEQALVAKNLDLTRGAVSQAVKRVWAAHKEATLPAGFEQVSVVLPGYMAFIVRKWAKDTAKLMETAQ